MKILLTGKAGSGKSSVLLRVVKLLKEKELKVGGIVTPEIRKNGKRIGFKVKDIFSDKEGILADVKKEFGPKVGKYRVNLKEFEEIALPALDFALNNCDVIVIDEIGKMEWFSQRFREKVYEVLSSGKKVIAVLHRKFVGKFKSYGKIFEVTYENREKLHEEITKLILMK